MNLGGEFERMQEETMVIFPMFSFREYGHSWKSSIRIDDLRVENRIGTSEI
jgi:hypothetical protein